MSDPKTARLQFDGELGAMYRIFLVNLLLTILTLGIYQFWGKTRVRRYLASHTGLLGDRFEYTGTGGELFRGFLIAVLALMLPAAVLLLVLHIAVGPEAAFVGQTILTIVLVTLIPVAQFTGTRYRLSRTQWRGVRFGLDGSPWIFAWRTFLARLVIAASFGLLTPQAVLALERYRLDRILFGDMRGRLNAKWREAPWLSWLAPLFVTAVLIVAYVGFIVFAAMQSGQVDAPPEAQSFLLTILIEYGEALPLILVLIVLLFLLTPLLFVWHQARFVRFLCTRWGLKGAGQDAWVAIYPPQSPWAYLRLFVGNYLILMITVGLGTPIVWRRTMRFASRFILVNADAFEDAAQSALTKPKRGEGLLEALDVGVV